MGISDESRDWLFEAYTWALRNYGGVQEHLETARILPNSEFFPVDTSRPSVAAKVFFNLSLKHAGLADWPIRLRHESAFSMMAALDRVPHGGVDGAVPSGLLIEGSEREPFART